MSLYDYSSNSVRLRVVCEVLFIIACIHRYYEWAHELWIHRTRIKDLVSACVEEFSSVQLARNTLSLSSTYGNEYQTD